MDDTYRNSLFEVSDYKLERRDTNTDGGRVRSYITTYKLARRRKKLEVNCLRKNNWSSLCVHSPPNMKYQDLTNTGDKCITKSDQNGNFMVIRDLNYVCRFPDWLFVCLSRLYLIIWSEQQLTQAYHQYAWFRASFVNYKKGALDSQSQVINLPVACPWPLVLSGYFGFLRH